jgi:3D (Asp-Asp-Asp) domain-containing protein
MKLKQVYICIAIYLILGILIAAAVAITEPKGEPPEVNKDGLCYFEAAPMAHKEKPVTEPPEAVVEEPELTYLGKFTITHYCACSRCCGKSDGITATGTHVEEGRTIAVDPRIIPYGTEVIIDGETYTAEDCGGFSGYHIDIYVADHNRALQLGVKTAEVYKEI